MTAAVETLARPGVAAGEPFAALRAAEFGRLDEQNLAYLDYAATGLYGASQAEAFARILKEGIFGNPHSEHGPSRLSEAAMTRARATTLEFFDADPEVYEVCFTANTTAAIKLVAESYPFGLDRGLVFSADNHNSVGGVREYARAAGARSSVLPLTDDLRLDDPMGRIADVAPNRGGLLAFPVQSNFSGVRHPLPLVEEAQALGFDVLLDAAGTGPIPGVSLRAHPAEFLVFSFYKLFGLPTGVGALVAKRSALAALRRPWFAGGTVDFVSVEHDRHQLRRGHEAFEDGTPNFLGIAAIPAGFELLGRVDPVALQARLMGLTGRFLAGVQRLAHANGAPLVRLYGPRDMEYRGCIVAFNILRSDGRAIPFQEVEQRARAAGVAIRGGCFCNPGAAEAAFGFSGLNVMQCLDEMGRDFSIPEFQRRLGPDATAGALRLSLGLPTNEADIDRAIDLAAAFREFATLP
jgi:selenocysteine lyase/cysteine desulfurase